MTYLDRALRSVRSLEPIPREPADLLELFRNPDQDPGPVCDAAGFDPGLTALLLGVANSALLASPVGVQSICTAVTRLGMKRLISAVRSEAVAPLWNDPRLADVPQGGHPMWAACVVMAIAAEETARKTGIVAPREAFTVALCADMSAWTQTKRKAHAEPEGAEWNEDGGAELRDDSEASAKLLEEWGLPKGITMAIRWHKRPDLCPPEFQPMADTVHVAQHLCGGLPCLSDQPVAPCPLQKSSLQRMFLAKKDLVPLIQRIEKRVEMVLGAFARPEVPSPPA